MYIFGMKTYKYIRLCCYDGNESDKNEIISRKPILRQIFVCSGIYAIYFVLGLSFGAPAVFIPQIRKDANSTAAVSIEMESWLTSVHGYSAIPWVFLMPIVTEYTGRKIPYLFVCVSTLTGSIVFYCSHNTIQLLISEIIQGILLASNMTLLIIISTEYTSQQYRGVFLSIKATLFYWGIWVANATGTFFHWKNIGIIALCCSVYSLTAILLPESPAWLAMKGRFEECAESHHWLKGFDEASERELESLISSQKQYLEKRGERQGISFQHRVRNMIKTILTKSFYKPLLLYMTYISLYHFSGKLVCTMYAVELIKRMTKNEYSAYIGMLILEGVTIFGMHIGCTFSKFVKTKTLLLGSSATGIMFLFTIALYLYLVALSITTENEITSIVLLTLFSVSISCGIMVLSDVLFGELIILRHKSYSSLILTLYSESLMATVLKLAPYMFKTFTLPGAFFFYGVSASLFTFILYKYLPETEDKTLQYTD